MLQRNSQICEYVSKIDQDTAKELRICNGENKEIRKLLLV